MNARRRDADQQTEMERLQAEIERRETVLLVAGAIHLRGHDLLAPDAARALVEASAGRLGVPISSAHALAIAEEIMRAKSGAAVGVTQHRVSQVNAAIRAAEESGDVQMNNPSPEPLTDKQGRTPEQRGRSQQALGQDDAGERFPTDPEAPYTQSELLAAAAGKQRLRRQPGWVVPLVVVTGTPREQTVPMHDLRDEEVVSDLPPEVVEDEPEPEDLGVPRRMVGRPPITMRGFLQNKTFEDLRQVYLERRRGWTAAAFAAALGRRFGDWAVYGDDDDLTWGRNSLDHVLRETWDLSWSTFREACEA